MKRHRSSWTGLGPRLGRILLVFPLAAFGWLSVAVTVAMVFGRIQPDLAQRWWPYSAQVRANVAAAMLETTPTADRFAEAARLARAALRREPVNVTAVRTLGLAAAAGGHQAAARRLMAFSESLSRRDTPTQLWLIELSVERDDIEGALRHYDRALTTSTGIHGALLPVLVQASADSAINPYLARLIERRPLWWKGYAERLVTEGRSAAAILAMVRRLRLRPGDEEERTLLSRALARLVELGDLNRAIVLYSTIARPRQAQDLVRDGGFEGVAMFPPFDWELIDEPGLAAIRQPRSEARNDMALSVVTERGRSGLVARQLLVLAPGRYRLTATVGAVGGEPVTRPSLQIRCISNVNTALARVRFPQAGEGGAALETEFSVAGSGCGGQWLEIESGSSFDPAELTPWVDRISVRPI